MSPGRGPGVQGTPRSCPASRPRHSLGGRPEAAGLAASSSCSAPGSLRTEKERREPGVRPGAGGSRAGGRPPQQFGPDRLQRVHKGPPTGWGHTAPKVGASAWTGRGLQLDRGAGGAPWPPVPPGLQPQIIGRPPRRAAWPPPVAEGTRLDSAGPAAPAPIPAAPRHK